VTPAPLQLTREDSLAIARAVEGRRTTSGSPSWSQGQIDSLKVQLERAMAESLGRVIAELRDPERQGADRGYTVRRFEFTTPGRMPEGARLLESMEPPGKLVAIVFPIRFEGQPDPSLFNAMKPMRDSLQRIVQRASGLDMIDLDSLSRASREHGAEVAVTLRNSVQVMAHFQARADSAVLQVMIRPPGWPVRGRTIAIESAVVPRTEPMAALESVAAKVDYMIQPGAAAGAPSGEAPWRFPERSLSAAGGQACRSSVAIGPPPLSAPTVLMERLEVERLVHLVQVSACDTGTPGTVA
jgi:hypothetical protein